jgi:uncharacterized membrane protein HdeD (DUF308 family)
MNATSLAKSRKWLIAGGIGSLVVGILAISFPLLFSIVLAQMLGAFALASGLIALFLTIVGKHPGHRIIDGLSAIIRIAAGIALFVCVKSSLQVITLIFAIFLLLEGIWLCFGAWQLRKHPGWSWTLLSGLAAVVLGIMIYSRWPSDSSTVLGFFFGLNLIFNASALLGLGLSTPKPSAV